MVFLLAGKGGNAQDLLTRKDLSGKAAKQYEQVLALSRAEDFPAALKELDKLLSSLPGFIDAYLLRGAIHYDRGSLPEAEADLEKALGLDPQYDTQAYYQLALAEWKQGKYDEAAGHFEQFLQVGSRREYLLERAKKYLADARFAATAIKNPVPFSPERLGPAINSSDPEYLPVLSADGTIMLFTRRVGNRQEDFFLSRREDGQWQPAQPLEGLNTPFNEGAHTISADGRLLVFTACNVPGSRGSCDLYFSEQRNGRWTDPEPLKGAVNTTAWEGQPSLGADCRTLFFASERPGGIGGRDIWVSIRQADGSWGAPVNAGDAINSSGADQCPFIHPDGQTLYFCSDGWPGMGGNDLFFSRKGAGGRWEEPQNLGYPINTPANEGTLSVSLDGTTAYFATDERNLSRRPAAGEGAAFDIDIYQFPLYAEARPRPVTYARGVVFDARDHRLLEAAVELIDLSTGETVAQTTSDQQGAFLVCLPSGKDYALNVQRRQYLFYSAHFSLSGSALPADPFRLEAPLEPLSPAAGPPAAGTARPVVLRNVFFATGSADLRPESKTELMRLRQLLLDNPALHIQINGHTDNIGGEDDNLRLSEARAKAVMDFLIGEGIEPARLRARGFGESRPIDTNDTTEGRQQNRRTEFEIWQ